MRRRARQWLTTNTSGLTWWLCWCGVETHPTTLQLHFCHVCWMMVMHQSCHSMPWCTTTQSHSGFLFGCAHLVNKWWWCAISFCYTTTMHYLHKMLNTTTTMPLSWGFFWTGAIFMCVQNWMAMWRACAVHHSCSLRCLVMWTTGWWVTMVWLLTHMPMVLTSWLWLVRVNHFTTQPHFFLSSFSQKTPLSLYSLLFEVGLIHSESHSFTS